MKQIVFILLSVGLAYLGSVEVARFLYGRYRSAVRLYRDLQLFFKERGKGKVVVTIRIPKRETLPRGEYPFSRVAHRRRATGTDA